MDPKDILLLLYFISLPFTIKNCDDVGPPKRYDGYAVLRIIPDSEEKLRFVRNLGKDEELDVWMEFGIINKPNDIMIPPQRIREIRKRLNDNKIKHFVFVPDVQMIIDEETEDIRRHKDLSRQKRSLTSFFENYHSFIEIYEYLDLLKVRYSTLIEVENVGTTYCNKVLKLVKITTNSGSNKPIIWIDGGIHAREWIAPATAMYFIYKLLSESDKDDDIKKLLEHYEWYIMPLVNPDGYDYTFEKERMWRKNLSKSPVHEEGVDLNRNFPFGWNNSLTNPQSRDPTSKIYMGPSALSERETQAIARILNGVKEKVILFVTLHSYSQLILFPWGCRSEDIVDYHHLKKTGRRAAKKIRTYAGTKYHTESIFKKMYPSPGNSIDWSYGELGIKYSYAFELRDRGVQNFNLSKDQIIPVGEETWLGIKSMISNIERRQVS